MDRVTFISFLSFSLSFMPEIEKNSASKIGTLVRNELVQNHFVNNNKTSIEEFSNRCLQKLERREIDLMLCVL